MWKNEPQYSTVLVELLADYSVSRIPSFFHFSEETKVTMMPLSVQHLHRKHRGILRNPKTAINTCRLAVLLTLLRTTVIAGKKKKKRETVLETGTKPRIIKFRQSLGGWFPWSCSYFAVGIDQDTSSLSWAMVHPRSYFRSKSSLGWHMSAVSYFISFWRHYIASLNQCRNVALFLEFSHFILLNYISVACC